MSRSIGIQIPGNLSPTMAQQIFTVISGIAGGAAGFVLAQKLSDKDRVDTATVIIASLASFALTFPPAFWMARRAE